MVLMIQVVLAGLAQARTAITIPSEDLCGGVIEARVILWPQVRLPRGILHRLGVHMGTRLIGYENRGGRGTGGFEAHGLAMICEQAYPFPSIERAVPVEATRRRLREWIDARQREAAWRGTIMGGKYPHLCFMIDLLPELEPESRFIHIDRPIEESIRSLVDRSAKSRGWLRATAQQCERLQRALWDAKSKGLARAPEGRVLTVSYPELVTGLTTQIGRIVDFLGLRVRPEQRRRAMGLVRQSPDGQIPVSDAR